RPAKKGAVPKSDRGTARLDHNPCRWMASEDMRFPTLWSVGVSGNAGTIACPTGSYPGSPPSRSNVTLTENVPRGKKKRAVPNVVSPIRLGQPHFRKNAIGSGG